MYLGGSFAPLSSCFEAIELHIVQLCDIAGVAGGVFYG
jgi:hypothetical protein